MAAKTTVDANVLRHNACSMKRTFAKWLTSHCPQTRARLGKCLLQRQQLAPVCGLKAKKRSDVFVVVVETGSGKCVGRFEFEISTPCTIFDVSKRLGTQAPEFPVADQVLCRATRNGGLDRLPRTTRLADMVGPLLQVPSSTAATTPKVTLVVALQHGKWDIEASDDMLRFSNDNRTVSRPGSKSCAPCAKADFLLQGPGAGFGVIVDVLEKSFHSLSIGVAMHAMDDAATSVFDTFPKCSSKGVGREPGSAGLNIGSMRKYFEDPGSSARFLLRPLGRSRLRFKPWWKTTTKTSRRATKELPLKRGDYLRFTLRRGGDDGDGGRDHGEHKGSASGDAGSGDGLLALHATLNGKLCCVIDLPPSFSLPLRPVATLADDCQLTISR